MARVRTAVLVSGGGSNLQALIDAAQDPDYPAEIVLVVSNEPEAYAIERAGAAGIDIALVPHRDQGSRALFERALMDQIVQSDCDLICLAGFMRILSADFVAQWQGRILNIHPSLLPAFPGLDTHRRALAAGVAIGGCTVHFVTAALDAGPIVGQAAVPVVPGDTADSLAARVLACEHRLYPACLAHVAAGNAVYEEGGVRWVAPRPAEGALINPGGFRLP